MKSRLQRKLKQFISQGVALLIERGYLTGFCKVDLIENREISNNAIVEEERKKHSDINIMSKREAHTESELDSG
jgi:hypothetical protein